MRHPATPPVSLSCRPDDSPDQLADLVRSRLEPRACWFEPFPFEAALPRIESDRIVIPADEPGTRPYRNWTPADGIELPVRHGRLTLGRFVLVPHTPTCGVAIPSPLRTDAIAIARRAGDALGRQWTATERRASAQREEHPRV